MRLLPTIKLAAAPCVYLLAALLPGTSPAQAGTLHMLVHRGPLAGSQYYAVGELSTEMRLGDALTLVREPGNRHDGRAIRVEWRGRKLGYLPRTANRAVSAAMDGGERLSARLVRLSDDTDPWRRVEIEVLIEL